MNNALTTLKQTFDPYAGHFYAIRATFLDIVQDNQEKNITEIANLYDHKKGFRTIISNIDIDFSPSRLTYINTSESSNDSYSALRLPTNLLIDPDRRFDDYFSPTSESSYTSAQWEPLPSKDLFYAPITEKFLPINSDSELVWSYSLEHELVKKHYIHSLSSNKCNNLHENIYFSPVSGSPWYGPLKTTPANANLEFIKKDEAINKSITYLFLESILNIINDQPQNPLIWEIFIRENFGFTLNFFHDSSFLPIKDAFNNFLSNEEIVRRPLDLIIYLRFPYEACQTRKNYEAEVFGNRVLNMNPLKPKTSNINRKPEYRRF